MNNAFCSMNYCGSSKFFYFWATNKKSLNKITFFILLFAVSINLTSQTFKTDISQTLQGDIGFPELLMKNGNTVFALNDKSKKTLVFTIFNSKHRQIIQKEISFKKVDFTHAFAPPDPSVDILKTVEIKGKIVLFIKDNKASNKGECALFRVIINANSAEIEEEELLFSINREGFAGNNPRSENGEDSPFYFISKDENSDYYAIIKYGNLKQNVIAGNYEIHWYSSDHKEINKSNFDYVNNKYEFARPLNLIVNANKYLLLTTYVYNKSGEKIKNIKVVFSKLEIGKTDFVHKEEQYALDFNSSFCTMKENKTKNLVEALIYNEMTGDDGKTYYLLIFQNINAEKMETEKPYPLPQKMLDEFVINNCKDSKGYNDGFIDTYEIDGDGNNIAICKKNVSFFAGGYAYSPNPELFGFSLFDSHGKELNAWAYPHIDNGLIVPVCNKRGNFMVMNELQENMDLPLDIKHISIKPRDASNAILVSLKAGGEIEKNYIFGKPAGNNNIYFYSMNYDSKLNTAVGIIGVGKGNKDKKVAWIKFD